MPSWWPLWALPWIQRTPMDRSWLIYWGNCTVGPTYDSLVGALGRILKYRIWRKF